MLRSVELGEHLLELAEQRRDADLHDRVVGPVAHGEHVHRELGLVQVRRPLAAAVQILKGYALIIVRMPAL